MPTVVNYRDQVDVVATTTAGVTYHAALMGDLVNIATSKSIAQSAGTFTLTFTSREDADGTWADKLPYRSYVEIRAGTGSGQPPILMRGLVDSGAQNMTMPPALNAGPTRRVVVQGRDLGALWTDWQVLYLWGIDPMATYLRATASGDALSHSLGLTTGTDAVQTIATSVIQQLGNKATADLTRAGVTVPPFTPKVAIPTGYQVNFLSLQPWQGPYANLMGYLASPPWGEWFVYDDQEAPQVILRSTPYKRYSDGSYPLPFGGTPAQNQFFADVTADAGAVTAHQLTRNQGAQEIYSYYVTTPDLGAVNAQSFAQWFYAVPGGFAASSSGQQTQIEGLGSNPFFDAAQADKFGIQPLTLTTPWISTLSQASQSNTLSPQGSLAAKMNTWLAEVFRHDDQLTSGQITLHGGPQYTIGRYLVLQPGNWEAYIEQVDHNIDIASNNATWTTNLGVVRGRIRGGGE